MSALASFMAVLVALAGYYLVEMNRRSEEAELRRSKANQIGLALWHFSNKNKTIYNHIRNQLSKNDCTSIYMCDNVIPILDYGSGIAIDIDTANIALLADLKEFSFLHDVVEAIERYWSIENSMREYRVLWEDYHNQLPAPKQMKWSLASFEISAADMMKIEPKRQIAEGVIRQLYDMTEENDVLFTRLVTSFHTVMKPHFQNQGIVVLEAPRSES